MSQAGWTGLDAIHRHESPIAVRIFVAVAQVAAAMQISAMKK
jgi:hypothetical protein